MTKKILLCILFLSISTSCIAKDNMSAVVFLLTSKHVETNTCNDKKDNDGDGWVDKMDPDCSHGSKEIGSDKNFECNDLIDNDKDGKIDSFDTGCSSGADNSEFK